MCHDIGDNPNNRFDADSIAVLEAAFGPVLSTAVLAKLRKLVPQAPLTAIDRALRKIDVERAKIQYLHGQHYLGPCAEPIVDAMHAFFRLMDTIAKVSLKAISAFKRKAASGVKRIKRTRRHDCRFSESTCSFLAPRWGKYSETRAC